MPDKAFLTEKRRDILTGDSHLAGDSLTVARSRLRGKTRTALDELIEVAESEEIENSEVFDPAKVAALIGAIMSPPHRQITPRWNFDGDDSEYRDRYDYEIGLAFRLDHVARGYADTLLRAESPADARDDFGGVVDE